MHALSSTGPQIGFAFVADGATYTSTQRLPALALAEIRAAIYRDNESRRATGHGFIANSPRSTSQLLPHYQGANPHIESALIGQPSQAPRVSCSSNAQPSSATRIRVTNSMHQLSAGKRPRVSA